MKKRPTIRDRIKSATEGDAPAVVVPRGISFYQFMHQYAKVRVGSGYLDYSTAGREPLRICIGLLDHVLGNDISYLTQSERLTIGSFNIEPEQLADACVDICGGAQFGKTILGLHLKAYLAAIKGMNTYYALPDDDLVQGVVDGKERPEVIDQIPWLAAMANIGKSLNESGRAVNRKGAMLYTDGKVTAISYMRGINAKVPTTFSADCIIEDEKDDIKESHAKFLEGRMTASQLRLHVTIGTQRYAGAGQNKKFEEGTQHVGYLTCPDCSEKLNPEESWPRICRMEQNAGAENPWLREEGDFIDAAGTQTAFDPTAAYYFACPICGATLDRTRIEYIARRPERAKARKWSLRVSQLCCSGLPVIMFASSWQNAVRDADSMKAFCCDRLAMPRSTAQAVTREVLERATIIERVELSLAPAKEGFARFGGLDTGDRFWFTCREAGTDGRKRTIWAESIAGENCQRRVPALFNTLGLDCLLIDAGPERANARTLCRLINNIPEIVENALEIDLKGTVEFKGTDLSWDGERGFWKNLRCAAVEFTGRPGTGIKQQIRITPANTSFYPVISVNRDEVIEQLIDQLLTAKEGYQQIDAAGKLRTEPVWLLPADLPGALPIVQDLHNHILSGSRKEKSSDGKEQHYIDKVANHLLLASTYANLAEVVGGHAGMHRNNCSAGRVVVPPRSSGDHTRDYRGGVML